MSGRIYTSLEGAASLRYNKAGRGQCGLLGTLLDPAINLQPCDHCPSLCAPTAVHPCPCISSNMAAAVEDVPVPPQYKHQPLHDFRQFPDVTRGFKVGVTKLGRPGTKRKLDDYAEQVCGGPRWHLGRPFTRHMAGHGGACMPPGAAASAGAACRLPVKGRKLVRPAASDTPFSHLTMPPHPCQHHPAGGAGAGGHGRGHG